MTRRLIHCVAQRQEGVASAYGQPPKCVSAPGRSPPVIVTFKLIGLTNGNFLACQITLPTHKRPSRVAKAEARKRRLTSCQLPISSAVKRQGAEN
jgi:hypothetical protein